MGWIDLGKLTLNIQIEKLSADLQADIGNFLKGDFSLCTVEQIDNELNKIYVRINAEGYRANEAIELFEALFDARRTHIISTLNKGGEA